MKRLFLYYLFYKTSVFFLDGKNSRPLLYLTRFFIFIIRKRRIDLRHDYLFLLYALNIVFLKEEEEEEKCLFEYIEKTASVLYTRLLIFKI